MKALGAVFHKMKCGQEGRKLVDGHRNGVIAQVNCKFRKTGYAVVSQFHPNNATGALLRTKGRRLIL